MLDPRSRFALAVISAPSALSACIFLSACVESGSSREEAKVSSKNKVNATRELLQSLRPEVDELLKSLDADSDPDGMPLLRKDGKLYYWGLDEDFPEAGITWVIDAWGRPVVLVESEEDAADWCLVSAGPDGLWTDDGAIGAETETETVTVTDQQAFADRAPHYYGAEDSIHRRVLGDDIVLHATGLLFKPYEHSVPKATDVVTSLLRLLSNGSQGGDTPASPDLLDELRDLTKEEKDVAAAFVKKHMAGFTFCEDTWSHECPRKDGFLPYLFLCHPRIFESNQPPFWIQPEEEGWVLDWNLDDLLDALDPERKKEP